MQVLRVRSDAARRIMLDGENAMHVLNMHTRQRQLFWLQLRHKDKR